ncbi:class I glutamine amidotransferase-like protein, partial [Mycena pura]
MPETLSIAVCVSDEVTLSDFVPPMEILAGMNQADHPVIGKGMGEVPYRVAIEYLAPTMDPVVAIQGPVAPTFNPTMTYKAALTSGKQFDILWVPAGEASRIPEDEIAFLKAQAPKARYVASVCAGSYQLAIAGILSGKRATTNKSLFRAIEAITPKDIEWVAKARWVVDGNVWTSSGVAAGADMALALFEQLSNAHAARHIRGVVEIPEVTQIDDPFAAFHGLV